MKISKTKILMMILIPIGTLLAPFIYHLKSDHHHHHHRWRKLLFVTSPGKQTSKDPESVWGKKIKRAIWMYLSPVLVHCPASWNNSCLLHKIGSIMVPKNDTWTTTNEWKWKDRKEMETSWTEFKSLKRVQNEEEEKRKNHHHH